jgi:hypothetical protein
LGRFSVACPPLVEGRAIYNDLGLREAAAFHEAMLGHARLARPLACRAGDRDRWGRPVRSCSLPRQPRTSIRRRRPRGAYRSARTARRARRRRSAPRPGS